MKPASTRLKALLVEHDQPIGGGVRKNLKLGEGVKPPPAVRREERSCNVEVVRLGGIMSEFEGAGAEGTPCP